MEYLLKSSAVIILFYVCYKIFLQRETFFESNRFYLLTGIILALVTPLIIIPIYINEVIETASVSGLSTYQMPSTNALTTIEAASSFDWSLFIPYIYGAGVALLCTRLLIQLSSLLVLIYKGNRYRSGDYIHVEVQEQVSPFSFFNYIVYNPKHMSANDLQQIITHEEVHVNQWHSIDILLAHLASILTWFNPIMWLYKKDMQQNLEFIADKVALEASEDTKAYQYILLRTSVPNYQMALTNNFYNSLIKKRIVMLNKNRSKNLNQLKLIAVLPLLALFLMSFNTKKIITHVEDNKSAVLSSEQPVIVPNHDKMSAIISKEMTDAQLDRIIEKFKKSDVTLKFKKIKRNKKNEITAIEISAKTDKSSTNFHQNDDNGIAPITITVHESSISIGNGKDTGHRDYVYTTNDGNHKIHTNTTGNKVFVFSDDNEHDNETDTEVIIHSDDKVHVDTDKKIHKVKVNGEGKDGNVLIEFDDDNTIFEIDSDSGEDDILIIKNKDGDSNKVKFTKKNANVWISDDDENDLNTFQLKTNSKGNKFFIAGVGDGNPLYIIDDKEISKKELNEKLNPNDIESVTVLKGKAAKEKYGKKANDGAVIIKTKDN